MSRHARIMLNMQSILSIQNMICFASFLVWVIILLYTRLDITKCGGMSACLRAHIKSSVLEWSKWLAKSFLCIAFCMQEVWLLLIVWKASISANCANSNFYLEAPWMINSMCGERLYGYLSHSTSAFEQLCAIASPFSSFWRVTKLAREIVKTWWHLWR